MKKKTKPVNKSVIAELVDQARDNLQGLKKDLNGFKDSLKITIPKKYNKDVEMIRELAKTNKSKEEFLINTLANRLNIEVNSGQYIILKDYIYNNLTALVKSE